MNRARITLLAVTVLLLLPQRSTACSLVGCTNRGMEMRKSFTVKVTFASKPLAGVQVKITDGTPGNDVVKVVFSGTTSSDGSIRISELKPGDYNLTADYLEIGAAYRCFHVLAHSGWKAKRRVQYEWGDLAPATRYVRGQVVNNEEAPNLSRVQRMMHSVKSPIAGATLTLRGPDSKGPYTTVTKNDGSFSFEGVPDGVYVLHLDAGQSTTGKSYGREDYLLSIAAKAEPDTLTWILNAGMCGGSDMKMSSKTGN